MITSTHAVLSLAVLSKRGERKRNLSVLAGSLLPDMAIFLWATYQALVNDVSGEEMWDKLYFEPPMQTLIAWFNSIPIYGALALIGFLAQKKEKTKTWGKLLMLFALAGLIHIATDMPVHSDDAYRHFWPISDWRFYSPLSYWDVDHHAGWVGKIDVAIALVSIAVLWVRHPTRWVKIALSITALLYAALLARSIFMG